MVNTTIADANIGLEEECLASGTDVTYEPGHPIETVETEVQEENFRSHIRTEYQIFEEHLRFMEARLQRLESAVEQTLELAIRTQQSAELVTTSVIHKTFDLITKQLSSSLIAMQQSAEDTLEDFKIDVIDHVNVKPTDETLIVTRTPEGELQYAKMSNPEVQLVGEVDKLDKYFNAKPELFVNDKVIFNVYVRKTQ